MKTDLSSLTYEELERVLTENGEPKFRAGQIFSWFARGVFSFAEMSDLSKPLRQKLEDTCTAASLTVRKKLESADGTVKYLFALADGQLIETVVMTYEHGKSVCISSQAGCRMGCRFCASTLTGKARDLTAGEMLAQVSFARREHGISHVVVMGVGEPLDNYDNLVIFLRNLNDRRGMNLGLRHVSVSTCGLVDRMDALARENFPLTLSVSLHAPDNETRDRLMPVNKKYRVEELIAACHRYLEATGRRISFEYTMVRGINDSPAHARRLAALVSGMLCHVNVIPVNYVPERGLYPSDKATVRRFCQILERERVNVTVRRTLGGDINASCGQLRHSKE